MQFIDKINQYLDKQSKAQLDKGRRIASFKAIKLEESNDKESYVLEVPSESSRDTYTVDVLKLKARPIWGLYVNARHFLTTKIVNIVLLPQLRSEEGYRQMLQKYR